MKILVTGAGGFIGSEIVRVFAQRGHEVIPVFSIHADAKNGICVDIADERDVFEKLANFKDIDAVIHSAGLAHQFGSTADEEFFRINVEGTRNICRVSSEIGVRRVILLSSVAVYGSVERSKGKAVDETSECFPESAYAKSKYESEAAAAEICAESGIALSIIRPATVIGEGDRGNVFRLIRAIDRGRFFWIGKGTNRKSLIHRTDVSNACATVLETSTELNEVLNCSAEAVEMKDVVGTIEQTLGKQLRRVFVPSQMALAFSKFSRIIGFGTIAETVEKWLADDIYSADLLRRKYDFVSEIPALNAIRREVDYYKK